MSGTANHARCKKHMENSNLFPTNGHGSGAVPKAQVKANLVCDGGSKIMNR